MPNTPAKTSGESKESKGSEPAFVRFLRADRDCEKRLRKDAEHALSEAAELIADIMRGEVNAEDECEKWLREFDPLRLEVTERLYGESGCWVKRTVRRLSRFAWDEMLWDVGRVEWKYGRTDDGKPKNWTEWNNVRVHLREAGKLRQPQELD